MRSLGLPLPADLTTRRARARRGPWRRIRGSAVVGASVVLAVALCAVLAPLLAPLPPNAQDLHARLRPPAWQEGGSFPRLLGTDQLGRDIFSRIIFGARVSVLVGLLAMAISGTLGVTLGLISGYAGGRTDAVIMRVAEVQLAMPFILLAILIVAVIGAGLQNVVIVLGVAGWMTYARIVRGSVLAVREKEFVEAARAIGAGGFRVVARHILPSVLSPVIVIATFNVAHAIIAEAALSFLGLGVEPSIPTWGGMLADGRTYLASAWWLATFPGLAIMVSVLGINLLGDSARDALDPRLRA